MYTVNQIFFDEYIMDYLEITELADSELIYRSRLWIHIIMQLMNPHH